MIKLNKKIVLIALVFILVISIISATSFVNAISDTDLSNYAVRAKVEGGTTKLSELASKVLGVMTVVGVLVSVGGIMIIGIQTMTASAQEKAVYKQKIIPFLIGFIIFISIAGIVRFIRTTTFKLQRQDPIGHNSSVPYDPDNPVQFQP